MEFEWDEAKERANIGKHDIPFEVAILVFLDPDGVDVPDDRFEYGERRYIRYGRIADRLHVVVYTLRDEIVRIISARKANQREHITHGNRTI